MTRLHSPSASRLVTGVLLWCTVGGLGAAMPPPAPPPGMVFVPGGEFIMGADDGCYDEAPAHRVELSPYFIDRHEVTVAEFAQFVRAIDGFDDIEGAWWRFSTEGCVDLLAHYESRYGVTAAAFEPARDPDESVQLLHERDALRWRAGVAALRVLLGDEAALADQSAATIAAAPSIRDRIRNEARLPVRNVAWRDAARYARWAGKRLPTEAEWEFAARGPDARRYPWGNAWDPARARAARDETAGPVAVGSFPDGASPFGCHDMAGNVWEWCEDWYGPATYTQTTRSPNPAGHAGLPDGELPGPDPQAKLFRESKQGRETDTRKVIRGGCWAGGITGQASFNVRCSRRLWSNPGYWSPDTGFRCAKDI